MFGTEWQIPDAVVDMFKDRGLTIKILMRLVKIGSLTLGRPLKHTEQGDELLIYVPDVQKELENPRAKPGGYTKWAKHEGFTSPKGIEYRTTRWAKEKLEIHFSRQTFRRFHDDGVIMSIKGKHARLKLQGHTVPVYLGNGTWSLMWVWRKQQLMKIKGFLRVGKIIHPEYGEG